MSNQPTQANEPARYALRSLKWAHCGKEGWLSECATMIEVADEGAGEFLLMTQPFAGTKLSAGGIAISPEEWPTLKAAIDAAFSEILQHDETSPSVGATETAK